MDNTPSGRRGSPLGGWTVVATSFVLVRVAVITVVWLGVFLLAFLGYLILPALVLVGFLTIYGSVDLLRARRRHREEQRVAAMNERNAGHSPGEQP